MGRDFVKIKIHAHQKLSKDEGESLVEWLLSLDKQGGSSWPSEVRNMANIMLSKRGHSTFEVGINWASSFDKRHESLRSQFAKRNNYERARKEEHEVINKRLVKSGP